MKLAGQGRRAFRINYFAADPFFDQSSSLRIVAPFQSSVLCTQQVRVPSKPPAKESSRILYHLQPCWRRYHLYELNTAVMYRFISSRMYGKVRFNTQ